MDERPLLKRATATDADQSDESTPQSKKARLSPSQESADTSVQETSAVETDSKEDLGYVGKNRQACVGMSFFSSISGTFFEHMLAHEHLHVCVCVLPLSLLCAATLPLAHRQTHNCY